MVFIFPPPWKMTFRRMTRLFEHETLHTLGKEHSCGKGDKACTPMTKAEYWSSQPSVPRWARGVTVKWNGSKRKGTWS